jgi:hypothetical protein
MASVFEEKETRSPTPDTLVEDPRNIGNVNDKAFESAEGSIKEDTPRDTGDESAKEEETNVEGEEDIEYASGFKLSFIVIALALSIFLVCHISLLRIIIDKSLTHGTGLIRYDNRGHDNPQNHG